MKLSLAWINKHLTKPLDLPAEQLASNITTTIAEIESWQSITYYWHHYFLAQCVLVENNTHTLFCPELNTTITITTPEPPFLQAWYLITQENNIYRYAMTKDFGSDHQSPLPPCNAQTVEYQNGAWRATLPAQDIILTVDNIAVAHRADLWSHRGWARELAALYSQQLIPTTSIPTATNKFEENKQLKLTTNLTICPFCAFLTITSEIIVSDLVMMRALASIDIALHDRVIDATNYVVHDIGQPLHAYQASTIIDDTITVRTAKDQEPITLLDATTNNLTSQDIVIADAQQPRALAGIMGAQEQKTNLPIDTTWYIESALFNPSMIKATAHRLHKTTDAATRFAKGVDQTMVISALDDLYKIIGASQASITTAGKLSEYQPKTITLDIPWINQQIGMDIPTNTIMSILEKLWFTPQMINNQITITVPVHRVYDITMKQDILEEISRYIGFSTITPQLPERICTPALSPQVRLINTIKNYCAYALHMTELSNYHLYDEQNLAEHQFSINDAQPITNPISSLQYRLVTSLIPNMLAKINQNKQTHHMIRFFEINHVYSPKTDTVPISTTDTGVIEKNNCALVVYSTESFDFYDGKELLNSLSTSISCIFEWIKPTVTPPSWFCPYKTAALMVNGTVVGHAGMINPQHSINYAKASIFIAEFSLDTLPTTPSLPHYKPLSIYPTTTYDISMFLEPSRQVASLEKNIKQLDPRIIDVNIVDLFIPTSDKPEEQRAITLRYTINDHTKTNTQTELDTIKNLVETYITNQGITVR
jgi:phenylalanyl-tRNA synthetase beta chain